MIALELAPQLQIAVYQPQYKTAWNAFVNASKNGVFLFNREYMEYHSNRFTDHSLLFLKNGKLVAIMPANIKDHVLYSHAGLTFGGVISGFDMTQQLMLELFNALTAHCRELGIRQIIYKTIPYIYHVVPADEDLYALFKNGAKLIARNVSSAIFLPERMGFDSRRKESLRKARKNGLTVQRSYDLASFMALAEDVLMAKHGVHTVHSLKELELLMSRFPENIKLFTSKRDEALMAGILVYESGNVAHGQYAANSEVGRGIGAQDIIEDYLINTYYVGKRYYDFGISTVNMGRELNVGLLSRKEGFGASAVNYDFYEISL
jgi:hypothetical protein